MIDYNLAHISFYTGTPANPPEIIGPLPDGVRVNFYSTGGEINGPVFAGGYGR